MEKWYCMFAWRRSQISNKLFLLGVTQYYYWQTNSFHCGSQGEESQLAAGKTSWLFTIIYDQGVKLETSKHKWAGIELRASFQHSLELFRQAAFCSLYIRYLSVVR